MVEPDMSIFADFAPKSDRYGDNSIATFRDGNLKYIDFKDLSELELRFIRKYVDDVVLVSMNSFADIVARLWVVRGRCFFIVTINGEIVINEQFCGTYIKVPAENLEDEWSRLQGHIKGDVK